MKKLVKEYLNEIIENRKEYVIVDMTPKSKYPFYDVESNSFFQQLPYATFFKSLDRAEKILKIANKKHLDKILEIKNVADVEINMGWN